MLGHLNTCFLMRNLNFWSKLFILRFWSCHCLRLLRPCNKWRGQKKIKPKSFLQYSWNSEVETTWISLIGWPHKTSRTYCACYYSCKFGQTDRWGGIYNTQVDEYITKVQQDKSSQETQSMPVSVQIHWKRSTYIVRICVCLHLRTYFTT